MMKRPVAVAALILGCWAAAVRADVSPGADGTARSRTSLDLAGTWLFSADPRDEGEKQGFMTATHDARGWREVTVPCGFGQSVPETDKYRGVGWCRKEFDAPEEWRGRRACLVFEAVNNAATVWLNDQPVGRLEHAFLPFRIDVSDAIRPGQKNVLVVRADNRPSPTGVPYEGGWFHDGGIVRGVHVETTGMVHVDDVAVVATPSRGATVTVRVVNALPKGARGTVQVRIVEATSGTVVASADATAELAALKSTDVPLAMAAPEAVAWSPDNPFLYVAKVSVTVDGEVVDATSTRFGFRTIETQGTQLLLNGKPLRILGFNRHEDTPAAGLAADPATARDDLRRMKDMGANFLRIHYPMDAGTLDLCDELGMLVMSEMPVSSGNEQAADYLAKMIARDRNRPSVIFWSVSNETNEQDRRVVEWNDHNVQLARSLDPTRLAVHVSERGRWAEPANHPLFTHDGVICLNGYPSELGRIWAKNPSYDFQKARHYWDQALEEIHRRYPDKPILVTEFGYPTGAALRESVDGEAGPQMQGRAIEAEFGAFHAPYVCGACIWCWADHPWPKGAYGTETSPYGIFTRDRQGKGAGVEAVVARLFKAERPAPDGTAPLMLENPFVAVEIDPDTGAVRSIRDKELGCTYAFEGIGFEVRTATGAVRAVKPLAAEVRDGEAVLRFADGGVDVRLHYTLGAEDRFVEKWLETRSADGSPFFLESITLEDAKTTAFSEIHFHDDQTIWHCPINLFLRGEQGGCYAGLEYPYWEVQQKGTEGFRIGYRPNHQAAAGEVNESEKYFLGVYRKEGIRRHSQGPYPGRGRSSLLSWGHTGLGQHFKDRQIPGEVKDVPPEVLDWGEVWAMQAFMRRIQPDDLQLPEDGYWIWQNGWWAGLFDPKPEILDTLKAAGIHDIMTAHTWYGRGNHPNLEAYLYKMRIDPPGFPQDAAVAGLAGSKPGAGWHAPQEVKLDAFKPGEFTADFKSPPAMEKFIEHGRKIGVHVSSFAAPGLLFEARPEWRSLDEKGNPSEYLFGRGVSCPACDDYTKHALAVHEAVFEKYQPRWWGWDGRWLSFWEVAAYRPGGLGVGPDPCFAKGHGHPPGDNRYREWKNIMRFLETLRQKHPRMCLEAYYGLKRGEPWALRHLNAADNYFETNGADMNRFQAWHNQNDRFRPVSKNYCAIFGEAPAAFQYNVISALSMSSYCQLGPGFKGLANPENREFLAKWRAWAGEHHAFLKVKRDLFDCPGDAAVDGSAHVIGDRGFVFLFPGGTDNGVRHGATLRASLPLNRWLGLKDQEQARYAVTEIYPRDAADLGVYRHGDELLYDMPAQSAVILSITPAPPGSEPHRPQAAAPAEGAIVVEAFEAAD